MYYIYLCRIQTVPIELTVKSHRTHKNFELLTFEGFNNINEVEKFRDGILKVPESQLGN